MARSHCETKAQPNPFASPWTTAKRDPENVPSYPIQLDYAHAAAPNVKLYINDYNIESVNDKSKAYAAIAKKLLDQGKPLHGIGFESHFVGNQVVSGNRLEKCFPAATLTRSTSVDSPRISVNQ